MKLIIGCLVSIFVMTTNVWAGTITLKSGKIVTGKITKISDDEIKIDVGVGFPITYYPYQIDKIGDYKIERLTQKDQPKTIESPKTVLQAQKRKTETPKNFKTNLPVSEALRPVAKNQFKPSASKAIKKTTK